MSLIMPPVCWMSGRRLDDDVASVGEGALAKTNVVPTGQLVTARLVIVTEFCALTIVQSRLDK